MHLFITGNMGYVGPVLVQTIRKHLAGAIITGFDTGYFAPCITQNPAILPETALDKQIFGDVRTLNESIFEGVDAVIYLSAISNDPMGNLFAEATDQINHQSTLEVALKAKSAGVSNFVFASSCSVYGTAEDGLRTELSTVTPLTPYAQSKVQSEMGLQELASPDFRITCLRFATACGPSPRLRLDLVLNDFVTDAMINGGINILSDGSPWRPLIDVRDMGKALLWAAAHRQDDQDFAIYNAGCNEWNFQIKDLAMVVKEVLGNTQVQINPEAQPDKRSYQVDFSKFTQQAVGFTPQRALSETITDLRDQLHNWEFKESDFRKSDWVRLNYLKKLIESKALNGELRWA